MCYDISFTTSIRVLSDYFPGLQFDPQVNLEFTADHVQAQAYQPFPVIVNQEGQIKVNTFEWGVIPDYFKTAEDVKRGRSSMCNTRSEKMIDDKRSYWHRIRHNRCLIPVTGIFEHREVKLFRNKIPYHVRLKDRELFFLPGLFTYPHFPDKDTGELHGTFSIVTRAANSIMEKIHNGGPNARRMPLFLSRELEQTWIQYGLSDTEIQSVLDYEMPAGNLEYWPVYTIRTTKDRPDQKRKFEPFEWLNLPEPGIDDPVHQQNLF